MFRKKVADIAMKAESKISSLKISKKFCVLLAAVIVFTGVGVSAETFNVVDGTTLDVNDSVSQEYQPTTVADDTCDVTIVKHGEKKTKIEVEKGVTVKQALSSSRVKVGKYDVVNLSLKKKISADTKIAVDKVTYKKKTVKETLTFKQFTKKYPDKSTKKLNKDEKVRVTKKYSVKYVNNAKNKSTLKKFTYKSIPTTIKYSSLKNVVSVLTPAKDFKLDKNGVPLNYSRKITGTASAYCCGTTTATGKSVKNGYVAVNPKQIPYGTKLFIRTPDGKQIYGYASAEDTGGFIYWGNTVADLYMSSYSDCVNWGRRTVEIYVLD